jgi:hypothetical protein
MYLSVLKKSRAAVFFDQQRWGPVNEYSLGIRNITKFVKPCIFKSESNSSQIRFLWKSMWYTDKYYLAILRVYWRVLSSGM